MKIIVFSQTGGFLDYAKHAIRLEHPDYMFHLGYFCEDAELIQEEYPQLPILGILGPFYRRNVKDYKAEERITLEQVRFWLCPSILFDLNALEFPKAYASIKKEADVILFSTYLERYSKSSKPFCKRVGDVVVMNPGKSGRSRRPSYAYLTVSNGTVSEFGIRYLK